MGGNLRVTRPHTAMTSAGAAQRRLPGQVREVKKLDSDMQMLVYENYNKFISATDTIRKMAQNVEGMEAEMADLGSSVDRISESSAKVNAALEGEGRSSLAERTLRRCHRGASWALMSRFPLLQDAISTAESSLAWGVFA